MKTADIYKDWLHFQKAIIDRDSLPEALFLHILRRHTLVMSKYELRVEQSLKSADQMQTPIPSSMIASETTLRMSELIVLDNMELIGGPNKSTILLKVNLKHTQAGTMSRGVVECQSLKDL
jgi:hypothetical protein